LSGAIAKLASINLRKLVLSPTGSINLGFILREDLLLCSSYLPLGVPNWGVIYTPSDDSDHEAEIHNKQGDKWCVAYCILYLDLHPTTERKSLPNVEDSGTTDKTMALEEEVPEEIVQKQVRSLTKLTKRNTVPPCPATPYTTSNLFPKKMEPPAVYKINFVAEYRRLFPPHMDKSK
jgi:hypothetical protein